MGFLALITREAPEKIAIHRVEIERIFAQSVAAIQATQQSTFEFYRKMEERLVRLPVEIENGIDAEAIAVRIGEGIRQRFNATGLPTTASALQAAAVSPQSSMSVFGKVANALGDRKAGLLPKVGATLDELEGRLAGTMGRLDTQLRRLQWSMLSGVGILCGVRRGRHRSGRDLGGFLSMIWRPGARATYETPYKTPQHSGGDWAH